MKKALIAVLIIPLVLISLWFVHCSVEEVTLSRMIEDFDLPIYIPNGFADGKKDYSCGFDAHLIWKYELNEKEVSQMEKDLTNGIWKTAEKEQYQDMVSFFFTENNSTINDVPKELTSAEGKYWCLYDNKNFVDESDFGKVFIYDSINETYWCSWYSM